MTAMGEAMEKAGIMPPEMRLAKLIEAVPVPRTAQNVMAALIESKDVEAALSLVEPQIVAQRLKARLKSLEWAGQGASTDSGQRTITRPSDGRVWSPSDIERAGMAASRQFPGHAKRTAVPSTVSSAIAKGVLGHEIGAGRRPIWQIPWREVEHMYQLRAKDALATAEEVVCLNVLRSWIPDDAKALDRQIGEDARLAEIRLDLEEAIARWGNFKELMGRRPVGDLESLLIAAAQGA